jgi:hypothetical protein
VPLLLLLLLEKQGLSLQSLSPHPQKIVDNAANPFYKLI